MYARIATFEGLRPEQVETLRRLGREQFLPQMQQLAGYVGTLMLHDPEAATGIDVEFFETEETLEAGHRELDAQSPPDELASIRRTKVRTYEVLFHEVSGEPAAARVSLLQGDPERIDEALRKAQDDVLPRARQLDGWNGIVYLADRETGKTRILTLWESAQARQASEEAATQLRKDAAEAGGETVTGVERFDVVALQLPVRTTT
ncbi:MAG: hypothetical protein C5B48_10420 [Candidatus Rokuibacteriota bacterium]|nr:MAG: hypothetical protein C5B48_10420 [Candidatus Rokubacteria bacterium]